MLREIISIQEYAEFSHPMFQIDLAYLSLTLGTLIFIQMLIIIFEMVILQLLRFGTFRQSLRAAGLMNLATTPVLFIVLGLVPKYGVVSLSIAWVLSVLIESIVLMLLNKSTLRRNLLLALIANLVSYLVVLLPAYLSV